MCEDRRKGKCDGCQNEYAVCVCSFIKLIWIHSFSMAHFKINYFRCEKKAYVNCCCYLEGTEVGKALRGYSNITSLVNRRWKLLGCFFLSLLDYIISLLGSVERLCSRTQAGMFLLCLVEILSGTQWPRDSLALTKEGENVRVTYELLNYLGWK